MAGRWWAPAAAAAAVVLVGAGTAVWARGGEDPPVPAAAPPPTAAAADPADPADLLVRDGDRVAVSGRVLALPGRPVRLCAPAAEGGPGYPEGQEPLPDYCELGVTVRGLDLDAVSERKADRGAVTGRARVEGRYAAGVVTVDRQTAPDPDRGLPSSLPERPPCGPPAGGWRPGQGEVDPLAAYLSAHPDRYSEVWVTYPDGYPKLEDGGATEAAYTTVAVAGTVLDPAVAEKALRTVYDGNLCVVRVRRPAATLTQVAERITGPDRAGPGHGIYSYGPDGITGTVHVELVVLDPAAQRYLRQADDRTDTVVPQPWVRPLR